MTQQPKQNVVNIETIEPMKKTNYFTNKRIGYLMLMAVLLTVIFMLLHPESLESDSSHNRLLQWVHGSLMLLLIINTYGYTRFADSVSNLSADIDLSQLFYYVGVAGFIVAATLDGFVLSSLVTLQNSSSELFSELTKFTLIINQAFAKLGAISFGAAGIFLFPIIQSANKLASCVAITACIVGAMVVIAMLSGLYLNVLTMTIITALIMIWHALIAWWLINN